MIQRQAFPFVVPPVVRLERLVVSAGDTTHMYYWLLHGYRRICMMPARSGLSMACAWQGVTRCTMACD